MHKTMVMRPAVNDSKERKGWTVVVAKSASSGGRPTISVYDAAVPDAAEAEEAVRDAIQPGDDTAIVAVSELSSETLRALRLGCGEVLGR